MPAVRCQREGRPGWKWGTTGNTCFIGPDAKAEAEGQGRAIKASQLRSDVLATAWYLRQDAVAHRSHLGVCDVTTSELSVGVKLIRSDARRRKPPRAAQPDALERRYRAQLRRRVRQVNKIMRQAINAEMKKLAPDINERARADGTQAQDMRRLLRVVDRVERAIAASTPIDSAVIERLGQQLNNFTAKAVSKQVATVVGIDVTATSAATTTVLEAWVDGNLELVGSLDEKFFEDVRQAITDTVGEGKSTAKLTKELQERFSVSKSRADLIATDQIGTLNSQITQARQTSLGISDYTWSDSNDQRVRPLHAQIDGQQFSWATGHPTEGHPGEPIRCRCSALPVL